MELNADLYEAGRRPGQRDGGHGVLVRQQPQHVAVRAEGDGVDARDPEQRRAHALVQAAHLHNNTWVEGETFARWPPTPSFLTSLNRQSNVPL